MNAIGHVATFARRGVPDDLWATWEDRDMDMNTAELVFEISWALQAQDPAGQNEEGRDHPEPSTPITPLPCRGAP